MILSLDSIHQLVKDPYLRRTCWNLGQLYQWLEIIDPLTGHARNHKEIFVSTWAIRIISSYPLKNRIMVNSIIVFGAGIRIGSLGLKPNTYYTWMRNFVTRTPQCKIMPGDWLQTNIKLKGSFFSSSSSSS